MSSSNDGPNAKCPFSCSSVGQGPPLSPSPPSHPKDPKRINLKLLRPASYFCDRHDYASDFVSLDLSEVKSDIRSMLTQSQPWWPADYGHYGPLMIRLAWHSAGTYRVHDGRGGANGGSMRFPPLDSWPDNANLDKARKLLWPIKRKYGRRLSWADLIVLAGNVALESMGLKPVGFGGGRIDLWEAEEGVYWGPEDEMLADERHCVTADGGVALAEPSLAADHMGLIYVNPEGPSGRPDPLGSASRIRETFGRMGMSDEETVALIAGGHTFGKAHGAAPPDRVQVGPSPMNAPIEAQGRGWDNSHGTGVGADAVTSGLEGAWTHDPIRWDDGYFRNLFGHDWVLTKSPGGAYQWVPSKSSSDAPWARLVPDAHEPNPAAGHVPIMFTTDLALKYDPIYNKISRRYHADPDLFRRAFAEAWYKLTHRDMGPHARLIGSDVPPIPRRWQDPINGGGGGGSVVVPSHCASHPVMSEADVDSLKRLIVSNLSKATTRERTGELSVSSLVRAAWASASTYRDTDRRGGANGGRVRLHPQVMWEVNDPPMLRSVLNKLDVIRKEFNEIRSNMKTKGANIADANPNPVVISMADMIVLGGCAAIEEACRNAGVANARVPFSPGRLDATQDETDVESFSVLEPKHDPFRNHLLPTASMLIDRASMLALTVPEMTVLIGGMRALDANAGGSKAGVLTDRPGCLTNDFFVNLLDVGTVWSPSSFGNGDLGGGRLYVGRDVASGTERWTATDVDLIFGSNPELRAVAETYACYDSDFVPDFVAAWAKVMDLDRFDLKIRRAQEGGGRMEEAMPKSRL